MKKLLPAMCLLCIFSAVLFPLPVFSNTSFSAHLGGNFFKYEDFYLSTGITYLVELENQMEINIGADFGINTSEDSSGTIVPNFLIPINVGLNFLFPFENGLFLFGTGLSPVFNSKTGSDSDFSFLLGPYIKGALRIQVHTTMRWFLEVQQDLLIGGDNWINTSTRVNTGINFSFGD